MKLIFDGEKAPENDMLLLMEEAAKLCLEYENVNFENVEISLTFVSADEIREINRDFRQIDKVTDVLSFPQFDNIKELEEDRLILLGDVVICEEKAKEQAIAFGHSYKRELIYLFVHSVFHLLGYDHMEEEEKAEMRIVENNLMDKMNIKRMD